MDFDFIKLDFILNFINSKTLNNLVLTGFLPPFNLFLIKSLIKQNKKVLYIALDEQTALKTQKDLENLLKIKSEILYPQEISLYSELEKNYYIYQEQINIFLNKPEVVIAPVKAFSEKFTKKDFYINNHLTFKKNDSIDYSLIAKKLIDFGYKRVTNVVDIGEFALRGDILDIYALDYNPIRIEFFADVIEDIRYFNPTTQKSFSHIEKADVYPVFKFILNDENKNKFIRNIEKIKKDDDFTKKIKDELIEKINNAGYFEGIEYYINYILDDSYCAFDFLDDYVVVLNQTTQILSKFQNIDDNFIKDYNDNIKTNLLLPLENLNHVTYSEFREKLKKFKRIGIDSFLNNDFDKTLEFDMDLAPVFSFDINEVSNFIKKYLNQNYKIFLCTNYPNRIKEIFDEFEIFSDDIFYFPDITTGGVISADKKISSQNIIFLTDKELFNRHNKDITTKKHYSNKQGADFIDSINDIKIGEYVVHSVHGIGIYNGITKQTIDDNQKDYLEIIYQGSDKLFMPAEQINLLCRFRGGANTKPKLSKMGGASWELTKSKAKKEVEAIAYDLLDLYAKRKMSDGIEFLPDTAWQYEMEENFEYTETPDQMKAIIDTKKDMEATRPMDRLICADVGFGKTEIAMRAIFKAVMSGYQAAMIAPTTILTMQHFEVIKERFKPFSVNVALLNRFCSKKEQKETINNLKEGNIDVVIATHRLLSNDIEFKKLGLLVVDEEHKFGVRHKEKLKKLKENIDVLSLSATPIPRTLNMALSGLKDLSVINTPPKNRLPIKTYVTEFNETYVKNAINQELQRDGQVFYLYNKVETIEKFKQKLSSIVPNAKIAIAHGQMNEKELEEVIYDFTNRKYDVLLCTTIIESGLDIPNANTIIIHDAQNFGLAQLYQLRGRVGRCEKQAYCFCFYKKSQMINEQAQKRLQSIKDFSSLGSGYKIALRDIEIRGVGNILGTSQHGQMLNVGFDTYCSLLNQCIEDIRNRQNKNPYEYNKIQKNEPAIVDINADAYIPDSWAQSYEQKILEYKRLSDVKTLVELDNMELNLKDRFSSIPKCVDNLIKLIRLRILATNANITHVRELGNQIRINTPFTLNEWNILKSRIEKKYVKYFTFTHPPKNLAKTKGILLMNKNEDDFDEIFNKLADLFYHISEVILNFKLNDNK